MEPETKPEVTTTSNPKGDLPRLRIREMHKDHGDKCQVVTIERAQELDYKTLITVLPNGKVIHSWDELLQGVEEYRGQEEIELLRFPPMAGG